MPGVTNRQLADLIRTTLDSMPQGCFMLRPPIHPPGVQLLLWDDVDRSAESLQGAGLLQPGVVILDEFAKVY